MRRGDVHARVPSALHQLRHGFQCLGSHGRGHHVPGIVLAKQADQAAKITQHRLRLLSHQQYGGLGSLGVGVDLGTDGTGQHGQAGQVMRRDVVQLPGHGQAFARQRCLHDRLLLSEQRPGLILPRPAYVAPGANHRCGDQWHTQDPDALEQGHAECPACGGVGAAGADELGDPYEETARRERRRGGGERRSIGHGVDRDDDGR